MRINHAILHVLDFGACAYHYASEEVPLQDRTAKNYIMRYAKKLLGSIDAKQGSFAEGSMMEDALRGYLADDSSFPGFTRQIAEFLAGELERTENPVSVDVLAIDFEETPGIEQVAEEGDEADAVAAASFAGRTDRYFAVLLLESKQAYIHEIGGGDTGERNDIVRHRSVLPNPSQKVQSYALINLRTMRVEFCDRMRRVAGEERLIIPEGLLQCTIEASSKEAFESVTGLVEEIAEEYGSNAAVAVVKAKAVVAERVEEDEEIDLEALAQEVFEDDAVLQERFTQEVRRREMPETLPLERETVRKVARSHKIRTDTGIEITFPAEYSQSGEYISFTSDENGIISIELRNITHIENR